MNKKEAIEELKKHVKDSIKLYERSPSYGFAEDSYRHRMFNEIIKAFEDPLTLADILGWEEGVTYKVGGLYYLVVGENLYYFKDFGSPLIKTNQNIIIDLLELANEAEKVEPKKYYLKHKYLRKEGTNYLGLDTYHNRLDVAYPVEGELRKTKFTEEDIEKIEATGFDLRNFEKEEVEDE